MLSKSTGRTLLERFQKTSFSKLVQLRRSKSVPDSDRAPRKCTRWPGDRFRQFEGHRWDYRFLARLLDRRSPYRQRDPHHCHAREVKLEVVKGVNIGSVWHRSQNCTQMTLPGEFKLFLRGWRFKLKKMSERVRFANCSTFWIYKILANLRDLYKRHEYRLFIFRRLTQCILVFSGLGHRWEFSYE